MQEQSTMQYLLCPLFYHNKGVDHMYYMVQTLVVAMFVRAFTSHVENLMYKARLWQTYVVMLLNSFVSTEHLLSNDW